MNRAYYNEIDPFAAAWLRNLIAAGLVCDGDVDERDIRDVLPSDLAGYTRHHFFAGLGGWDYALRLAGWPDERPVWTGSCPCQPFSAAGKGAGFADERHLWPAWHWLISQSRPALIFGEQVAAKAVEPWVDLVQADLEAMGYAFDAIPFPAASVGAPHIRDRLSFVADTGLSRQHQQRRIVGEQEGTRQRRGESDDGRYVGDLADTAEPGRSEQPLGNGGAHWRPAQESGRLRDAVGLADSIGERLEGRDDRSLGCQCSPAQRGSATDQLADANQDRRDPRAGPELHDAEHHPQSRCELGDAGRERGRRDAGAVPGAQGEGASERSGARHQPDQPVAAGATHWSDADWLPCRDGKARPIKPGIQPLAHGIPARVGKLRAAGNAIVPQAQAEFIGAYLDRERVVTR